MPAWTNNPFWRPANGYGGRNVQTGAPMDWYNTPLSEQSGDTLGRGEFERFLTEQGYGGFGRRDAWGRSMERRAETGFQAAQLSNPALTYRNYLNTLEGGWLNDAYAALSPEMRGDSMPGQTRRVMWG